jgi:hypothetical protein
LEIHLGDFSALVFLKQGLTLVKVLSSFSSKAYINWNNLVKTISLDCYLKLLASLYKYDTINNV